MAGDKHQTAKKTRYKFTYIKFRTRISEIITNENVRK